MAKQQKITTSSTAEYFAKNLQQVGFSSPTKAVLTTLKEAVDNSLDACEDAGILPELHVEIEKKGAGTIRNSDLIRIRVSDNGPGLALEDVPKVFGEYLASSKFGRGRCSRGQQGIGISAATTWAQLTSAGGAKVITKTKKMRNAVSMNVHVDIKNNKGLIKNKESLPKWDRDHGTSVEFVIDGRIQLNGEGGLITYLTGNTLVNPHMTLKYKLPDQKMVKVPRVSKDVPKIPDATDPHPHTMKLGEFINHSHLFGTTRVSAWLKKGFSRISDNVLKEVVKNGADDKVLKKNVKSASQAELKELFQAIQKTDLMAPTTRSVMTIGEEGLSHSVKRLGDVDFFSVVTRKPKICDFKPVAVEVAVARLIPSGTAKTVETANESASTVLRFSNRVPLQFDKSSCAMYKAVETVNWRAYGLNQPRGSVPTGPYVVAVSLVSPFIKYKNASKETVDASDELVEEIRRALMQAGQRLSRHIKKEHRAEALENKIRHIEQFCPILVSSLCSILKAPAARKKRATEGLLKLLGRDVNAAKQDLKSAEQALEDMKSRGKLHQVKKAAAVKEEKADIIAIDAKEAGVEVTKDDPNIPTESELAKKSAAAASDGEKAEAAPKKAAAKPKKTKTKAKKKKKAKGKKKR